MAFIDSAGIYKKANKMVHTFETREPLRLARYAKIDVRFFEGKTKLLGMYCRKWRRRIMLLSPCMSPEMERMVIAHEMGHDALHKKQASGGTSFNEFVLFDMINQTEYEANAFAAHLLIDDVELFELMDDGCDIF
jgi:Predicted Zn peptidase